MSSALVAVLGYGLSGVFTFLGCAASVLSTCIVFNGSPGRTQVIALSVSLGFFTLGFIFAATTHAVLK